jgi:Cd2+/Zn2+-exporting ATPase
MITPAAHDPHSDGKEKCLARSVADTLAEEPGLEAVTIDRAQQKISVATLGRTDVEKLTERVSQKLAVAQSAAAESGCSLLAGKNDCGHCRQPLSEEERRKINIHTEGTATTIARVTCPTAPKFWRWRDLPLPRIEPRTIEIEIEEEDEHHADEWKWQLAAAVVCGVFGLLGALVVPDKFRIATFVIAYLAGGYFAVEETWERLQKRVLDIHFLMLAVAIGAAFINAWAEGATLLFLFSLSGALEHFALGRTQQEIHSLFHGAPKVATVLEAQGNEREVKVESLKIGMRLLIKPGAQFPVDAEITKGKTAADESNLTGEATPVDKIQGDSVRW